MSCFLGSGVLNGRLGRHRPTFLFDYTLQVVSYYSPTPMIARVCSECWRVVVVFFDHCAIAYHVHRSKEYSSEPGQPTWKWSAALAVRPKILSVHLDMYLYWLVPIHMLIVHMQCKLQNSKFHTARQQTWNLVFTFKSSLLGNNKVIITAYTIVFYIFLWCAYTVG